MDKKKLRLLAIGLAILTVSSTLAAVYMFTQNRNSDEEKIRVACVGDSITGGTDYPSELGILLGSSYTVGNFGVGGSTVSLSSWKPYMNESAFQEAKEFQPNIVIIMLGTNDADPYINPNNGRFIEDYLKLVEAFEVLSTKPKIYLVLPPPVFSNETRIDTEFFADNVILGIEEAAKPTGLPIINVYLALADKSDFFPDGIHPNVLGAKLIANEVYKAIT
jgi:lysophospholipase L1-like esterase